MLDPYGTSNGFNERIKRPSSNNFILLGSLRKPIPNSFSILCTNLSALCSLIKWTHRSFKYMKTTHSQIQFNWNRVLPAVWKMKIKRIWILWNRKRLLLRTDNTKRYKKAKSIWNVEKIANALLHLAYSHFKLLSCTMFQVLRQKIQRSSETKIEREGEMKEKFLKITWKIVEICRVPLS